MLTLTLPLALLTTVVPPVTGGAVADRAARPQLVAQQGWRNPANPGVPVEAPPPPVVERQRARRGWVWVGGNYQWRDGRYVWMRGHWERERPGWSWREGRWENQGGRYVWVAGGWEAAAPPP